MTQTYTIDTNDLRTEAFDPQSASGYWDRAEAARAFDHFQGPNHASQRQYAREHGIPRSTLGDWLREEFPEHLDPDLVAFFRGSAGYTFLCRLVLALLVVFHHRNACGLRQIALLLELVELDHFVATSYGALHSLDARLQDLLILFGQEQRQHLATAMKAGGAIKDIILCLDEHFHAPQVCLVGMEPVSGFIVVETYADRRDGVTWARAVNTAIEGLPIRVVCLTSDQASGLVCCAETELKVQHHPDLMHLQQGLGKFIVLPLARPINEAKKDLEKAKQQEQRLEQADQKKPEKVTVEMWVQNIQAEDQARAEMEQVQERLDDAVEQIREVGRVYHPFDRETGEPVTPEQIQAKVELALDRLEEVVEEAGLGQRAQQAVPKARQGWVVLLVGCLAWYWRIVEQKLEDLDLSDEQQQALKESLMAGSYWEMAAAKEKDPEQRKRLLQMAARLKAKAWCQGSPLAALNEDQKRQAQTVARECAELFQRSSSCVEGRNGRLSLLQHGQTRLSQKRLTVLTVIHNYVLHRKDGTTAAERFFGHKQRDPIDWLLQRFGDLPRPAAKRPNQTADRDSAAA